MCGAGTYHSGMHTINTLALFRNGGAIAEEAHDDNLLHRTNPRGLLHKPEPPHQPRRRLAPDESIIQVLNDGLNSGVKHPRFTITAIEGGESNSFTDAEPFQVDVVLTNPSVTNETFYSINGGENIPVDSSVKLLVADAPPGSSKSFAILQVNEEAGTVEGFVQDNGRTVKLEQHQGQPTTVRDFTFKTPKDWACTAIEPVKDHEDRHLLHEHSHNPEDLTSVITGVNFNPSNRRRVYATDTFPQAYSYQVDLYIEVDTALVDFHDPGNTVNMPNTINYVVSIFSLHICFMTSFDCILLCIASNKNALVSASSTIYEKEIDTHLNVLHIAKTSIYDNLSDTGDALNLMESTHGDDAWHYQDPNTGAEPDLHHGVFYKSMGGGIAYRSAICSSSLGFGVSAGMQGTTQNIADAVSSGSIIWDISVFAHELGVSRPHVSCIVKTDDSPYHSYWFVAA
jgi:hypothetical protein